MFLLSSRPWLRIIIVLIAIAASISSVGSDSWRRYRRITTSMVGTMGTPFPAIDATSPTGYELGMRNLLLPQVGIDGLHWIMHTQKLLADGGWRIRSTDIDNAPDGREIHWSHGFIWWLIFLGKIHSAFTGLPLPASVEAVAPWANTLLLVFLIAGLPWVTYKKFGPFAAGGLALGLSSIYVFFEFFMVGNADHHGIAAASALACALLLAVGGAGWVSVDGSESKSRSTSVKRTYEYLIDSKSARHYFIGSGIAGSAALWVSAATAVPTFFGIGLGALISVLFFGRHKAADETRYLPELWRFWGITGCCGSLFFYALEYFPFHMGMRLEVNHPLYALAWIGGGDILARLAQWRVDGTQPWKGKFAMQYCLASCFAVLLLPVLVKLDSKDFFWIADNFLWQFHKDYIHEFKTIWTWAKDRSFYSFINVALFPLIGVVVFRLIFLSELGRSWKGILTLIVLPAILVTVLGAFQVRWLGIANALWLPAIPTALGCIFGIGFPHRFAIWERVIGVLVAAILFLVFPVTSMLDTVRGIGRQSDLGPEEAFGIYIRDLSHALRRANPDKKFVIVSGPTTTTYMMYYGGMKGIGTLYWENVPGLKATAEIYAAHTESEAYELVKRHGVSHIAIFSSDAFSQQYTRLIRGLPFEANPQDAFIPSLLATSVSPRWLKPIHFLPPTQLASETLILMEIKLDQTLAEAHYSVSEYLDARGQAAGSILELQKALTVDPNYREAWFRLGSMKLVHEGVGNAKEAIEKGLAGLTPKEASSHCEKLAMKFFQASRHAEAVYMLRRALEALPGEPDATNALAWVLATSYIDAIRDPAEALTLAEGNDLNPSKSAYFDTLAAAQAVSGKVDEAIATQKKAIESLKAEGTATEAEISAYAEHLRHYESGLTYRTGKPQ